MPVVAGPLLALVVAVSSLAELCVWLEDHDVVQTLASLVDLVVLWLVLAVHLVAVTALIVHYFVALVHVVGAVVHFLVVFVHILGAVVH